MKKWQKIVLIVMGMVIALTVVVVVFVKAVLVPKVTDRVIEKVVTSVVPDEYAAKELYESIDAEDKEFIEEVLVGYATDLEAVESIKEYVDNNDYTGLKDYAINNLSPEQMDKALDIAEKYQEFLPPEGQEMLKLYLKDSK